MVRGNNFRNKSLFLIEMKCDKRFVRIKGNLNIFIYIVLYMIKIFFKI